MIRADFNDFIEDTVSLQDATSILANDEAVATAEEETTAEICKNSSKQKGTA